MFSAHRRETREGRQTTLGFTSHRQPPTFVPASSVLVQVWAVGVDTLDGRLVGVDVDGRCRKASKERAGAERQADIGYIPGRSFVGRILQCGWEVRDEHVRKGDWVVGLLDVRKAGALAEFVVVDRHRVRRVPQPQMPKSGLDDSPEVEELAYPTPPPSRPTTPGLSGMPARRPSTGARNRPHLPRKVHPLTLEELALLPLVGVPAFRAVRTLLFAFAGASDNSQRREAHQRSASMDDIGGRPTELSDFMAALSGATNDAPRALVLMGHDGVGAFATQLLVRHGWRVSVHAPGPRHDEVRTMTAIEARARRWGAEEVVFDDAGEGGEGGASGAIVRVLERLLEDGDAFDAVLDTVGGRTVWEAAERLLRGLNVASPPVTPSGMRRSLSVRRRRGPARFGQFTTLVGDTPDKPLPTAGDHFRAGMRSMRTSREKDGERERSRVGYAWVDPVSDVDWASASVGDAIEGALAAAMREGVRPWVAGSEEAERSARVMTFERAPDVFVDGNEILEEGGTVVVKVVG
ncbi:hypothetical protein BD626DRAFT_394373 [Schizophyllum amplum]|uniref:Uncharacterized protein n=1 Tax=Schizophyllum amplum TaxID=97359 RepID=A0A550CV05_9AGAR|nr:hypothetical protein BD626DRAFT_394373 [Auriculariopsis ampla]